MGLVCYLVLSSRCYRFTYIWFSTYCIHVVTHVHITWMRLPLPQPYGHPTLKAKASVVMMAGFGKASPNGFLRCIPLFTID